MGHPERSGEWMPYSQVRVTAIHLTRVGLLAVLWTAELVLDGGQLRDEDLTQILLSKGYTIADRGLTSCEMESQQHQRTSFILTYVYFLHCPYVSDRSSHLLHRTFNARPPVG